MYQFIVVKTFNFLETISTRRVETRTINGKESIASAAIVESSDSISTTLKTTREQIAAIQKPLDEKPTFSKNLRGTNIERKYFSLCIMYVHYANVSAKTFEYYRRL